MCPVGQLSDPFNQGQDEDWEDVSISGLPTEPDEPPPDDQEEAEEALATATPSTTWTTGARSSARR